jgi:hypothetical protein
VQNAIVRALCAARPLETSNIGHKDSRTDESQAKNGNQDRWPPRASVCRERGVQAGNVCKREQACDKEIELLYPASRTDCEGAHRLPQGPVAGAKRAFDQKDNDEEGSRQDAAPHRYQGDSAHGAMRLFER